MLRARISRTLLLNRINVPRRLLLTVLPVLAVTLFPARADAYAWMIRHGYGACSTCHVDPSGGELLTRYGRIQGDLLLRTRYGRDNVSAAASEGSSKTSDFDSFDSFDSSATPADEGVTPAKKEAPAEQDEAGGASRTAGFLWGLFDTPDWLLLGGAYRHLTVYKPSEDDISTFPMQMDLFAAIQAGPIRAGGTIGAIKVDAGSPHGHAAQITTEQGDKLNLVSRTHWVGVDVTPNVLVRAGRLNLPFGVRIPEHNMWIREATRTDRESDQQYGASIAFQGGTWLRGEVMGIAGNYQVNPDRFRERGYSLFAEAMTADWLALGVSSLVTRAKDDRLAPEGETMIRHAHGAFARIVPWHKLAILVEGDGIARSRAKPGYVGFAQADLEIIQGLHFMLTGEVLDQGKLDSAEDRTKGFGKPRLGGWATVDWFFLPHFEVRVDALKRENDPFTLLGQLHVYL